jgi:hypothetical protein
LTSSTNSNHTKSKPLLTDSLELIEEAYSLTDTVTLLGVDGVVWQTEDTPDNAEAFSR